MNRKLWEVGEEGGEHSALVVFASQPWQPVLKERRDTNFLQYSRSKVDNCIHTAQLLERLQTDT